jgi:4-amino-4-deoxy-L-arabinose transferase-like glycosyltransferase
MHLPAVALPWTPVVALALWRAWRTGGLRDPRLRFLLCWAAAPVVAFTPAEWKLRHYLLPSVPALALIAAPTVLSLLQQAPRRLERRAVVLATATVALVVGAGVLATRAGWITLSRADRSTLEALLPLVPGGPSGAIAAAGFVAGLLFVTSVWRAWAALLPLVALATACWMVLGVPALEQAVSRRDSLKEFARAVAVRRPAPSPLGFWKEPVRTVAVYVGRGVPTLRRREELVPGLALIASEPAARTLSGAGVIVFPLLAGEGRLGNVARGRVMLLEIAPGAPAR